MKRLFIVTIIALSGLFSCSENGDIPLDTPNANTTGLFTRTLSHDGITREYEFYMYLILMMELQQFHSCSTFTDTVGLQTNT